MHASDTSANQPSPAVRVLMGLILTALGVATVFFLTQQTWFGFVSYYWPTASGTISHSAVVGEYSRNEDGSETLMYSAEIHYRYRVGNRDYQGERVSFGGVSSDSWGCAARSITREYPGGRSVSVRYDPRNPERAVLEPGISIGLLVANLIVWGLAWGFLSDRIRRHRLRNSETLRPNPE